MLAHFSCPAADYCLGLLPPSRYIALSQLIGPSGPAAMVSPFWRENCGDRLNMFVNMESHCDTCVKFGDGTNTFSLKCHYVVLALHSDVFRDNIHQYPAVGGKRVISFTKHSQVDQTVIADIILAFYNGILTITEQNFSTVYKFSVEYKVKWIQQQALVDLHTFISSTNLLRYLQLSEHLRCKKLRGELIRFIVQTRLSDYRRILTPDHLRDLSPTTLKMFLKATKTLEDRPELETLRGVLVWMGDSGVRLTYTETLLECISWERLAGSESEVEELTQELTNKLTPRLNQDQVVFVRKCLQDSANFAACSGTMREAMAVFNASRWATFPLELAEFVLSSDFITVTNEYVVAEAALVWLDEQDKVKIADTLSVLSTIRVNELHSSYILQTLQPHVARHEVSPSDWLQICAHVHTARKNTDHTVSGSVVTLTPPSGKKWKDLIGVKNGTYTFTAPCKCSYLSSTSTPGAECLRVTITIQTKSSPPVAIKHSQCQHCNRVALHVFCETPNSTHFPSLICGGVSRVRHILKLSRDLVVFKAVLSEAEKRSGAVRRSSWYKTPVRTVVRTLNNNNVSSLTEYELLEAALDWLDYRMPDNSYHEVVLSCVRLGLLHEVYLKDVVVRYLKENYFIKTELLKSLMGAVARERRGVAMTPCYKKIVRCRVPLQVIELKQGDHLVEKECMCEISSNQSEIHPGTLNVTMTVHVQEIPALRVTATCSKCNISLRHAYLSTSAKLSTFPGLATASVYRLRELFATCLHDITDNSENCSSESDDVNSPVGEPTGDRASEGPGKVATDKLSINLILGP